MTGSNPTTKPKLTLGRLVLETARGDVKERTLSATEAEELRDHLDSMAAHAKEQVALRYYVAPFRFIEPESDHDPRGPHIVDANGNAVAMLYWSGHPIEETEAAEQETYRIGRAMAAAIDPNSNSER